MAMDDDGVMTSLGKWTGAADDPMLPLIERAAQLLPGSPLPPLPVSRSRPIKSRRTKEDMRVIKNAISRELLVDNPMTVRQLFYRLVSRGVIPKTDAAYKNIVVRLLTEMRKEGRIPYRWIADSTRWMRKPTTYSGLQAAARATVEAYRRSVWDSQNCYVEIWLEKDALAGVLVDVTSSWDVPLMVTRGYSSLSFLHSAAETIAAVGKPAHIYYLGDMDPSGMDIPRKVEQTLRELAPKAVIHFQRVAVTQEQVETMGLPTRPTKSTDSRAKDWVGGSVEVDSIPPAELKALVSRLITQHVDQAEWEQLRRIETEERRALDSVLSQAFGR